MVEVNNLFDPDKETNSITYQNINKNLGNLPLPSKDYRVGVVVKNLGNPYWQLIAEGIQAKADILGITVDILSGATENDPDGQRLILETMLKEKYDAFIISPQTASNLENGIQQVENAGLPVLIIDETISGTQHWIGPDHYESGLLAGEFFKKEINHGQVAVIKGTSETYAAQQRTQGLIDSLANSSIEVVTIIPANWDLQQSRKVAQNIIQSYPDIQGIYCNNDIMALGALAAIDYIHPSKKILIVGTDGIQFAIDEIHNGRLAATIDSSPYQTGGAALEVIIRLLEGQAVPKVVYTPQQLVTPDTNK